jgi:predicted deacylase
MASFLTVVCSVGMPTGERVDVVRRRFSNGTGPRMAIVAGVRGDTPEGIRVAHIVASHLQEHHDKINGTVDIYPCVNPLAAHRGMRRWPFFDQDLNRRFPGREGAHAPDQVAYSLVEDLRGIDQLIEVRGANPAFTEALQAQVRHTDQSAAELARHANVEVVWARTPGPAAPSTLVYQFPSSIVLEGGTGNRLTAGVAESLANGVLNVLNVKGILPDEALPFHWAGVARPRVVADVHVQRVRAEVGGLFLPMVRPWGEVEAEQIVGEVVDPIGGRLLEEIRSPKSGRVLALREQPVVLPGTMVARIVTEADDG